MIIQEGEYSHIGNRPVNEDSIQCTIDRNMSAVAVLADGLGAHGGGSTASKIAVRTLSPKTGMSELPTANRVEGWIQTANREILSKQTDACKMRTTLVYLAVVGKQAIWAHVGDSRLYYFYNGVLVDYTLDHSVPQIQVKTGEITRDEIRFSPDRNRLLRALGSEELRTEIHAPVTLAPGRHAFLLCSDGFWEYLSDMEIWMDLQKSASPQNWIDYLRCRGEMRKQGSIDNNSAIAIYIDI